MFFSAFRLYIYFFVFLVITFLFFLAGGYISFSLNSAFEEQNSELVSERMDNVTKDLMSNYDLVSKHAKKLQKYIQNNPDATKEDIKSFVELNLLPKDLSAFFNSNSNDFISGYLIAPNDSFFVVSNEPEQNFSQLNFYDSTTEYYLDLAKRNPDEVIVHGPIVSPRTHEINVFNRKAVYVDGKYWGYVGVVVDFYKLLDCMKLKTEDGRFIYSIKSSVYKSNRDFIWGDSALFKHRNLVSRQKTVFFGKQHWDFAIKVKDNGRNSILDNKIYFVLSIIYIFALYLGFSLTKTYLALNKSREIDPITSTLSHVKFIDYVKHKIKGTSDCGVVVLELIHFNQINSSYDFMVGDALLCETTKRIKSVVSYKDLVCRIGAEFIILIRNIRSNVDVDRIEGELYDEMKKNFNVSDVCINMKCVIASSSTISKGRDYNEIMREISESLLEKKKSLIYLSRDSDLQQNFSENDESVKM